eukprot:MONOS_919.1-p1 / transcript=MONOS_919.1 / gene=MONOS_919 / organism=Monocercomonoides_exilis_PA203 / gene_product=unspecified product / transcript_product=unspecified product / location=Mono_scaffold00015:141895-142722(-) / protein_length=276 / sequence_SO=supercontig / SO=protein_coding / is_pseudo=false
MLREVLLEMLLCCICFVLRAFFLLFIFHVKMDVIPEAILSLLKTLLGECVLSCLMEAMLAFRKPNEEGGGKSKGMNCSQENLRAGENIEAKKKQGSGKKKKKKKKKKMLYKVRSREQSINQLLVQNGENIVRSTRDRKRERDANDAYSMKSEDYFEYENKGNHADEGDNVSIRSELTREDFAFSTKRNKAEKDTDSIVSMTLLQHTEIGLASGFSYGKVNKSKSNLILYEPTNSFDSLQQRFLPLSPTTLSVNQDPHSSFNSKQKKIISDTDGKV